LLKGWSLLNSRCTQMSAQVSITPFSGMHVAIVTGGAQGIGKAIALRLASDGYDVCMDNLASSAGLLDNVVSEIQQLGRKAMALSYDVTKENEVKKLVEETVAELGSLDLVSAYMFSIPPSLPDFLQSICPDGHQCWNYTPTKHYGRYLKLDLFVRIYFNSTLSEYR